MINPLNLNIKPINWSGFKNEWLKETRGISFNDVLIHLVKGKILDHVQNKSKNHRGQKVLIVEYKHYVYLVPYVETEKEYF